MLFEFVILLLIIVYSVYYTLKEKQDYWKKRKVPYVKPKLLFGNYMGYILQKQFRPQITSDICKQYPEEPYIGSFFGTEPALIVQDPDLIKLITTKDFYYFSGKEVTNYAHKETLTRSLNFAGGDDWKILRLHMSPLFTSSKLKSMFPLIIKSTTELQEYLEMEIRLSQKVNVRSLLARYTMDCVISCIFGINANSMKRDISNNPFLIMGNLIFDTSISRGLKMVCRTMWPALFYRLGYKLFDEQISKFFSGFFAEACKGRLEYGNKRNDFIDMIVEWKKIKYISSESLSNFKIGEKKISQLEVTDDLLAGQSLALFGAGYKSTSTTVTFLLYELAKDQQIQNRVIEEVDSYFKKHDSIDYECVNELSYLEACIDETLRLYPVVGIVTREVMDDYTLPTGLHLKKEIHIHIPIYQIHRNPKNFPQPEIYRPERFLGEERKKIKPFTFMPFGEGPRICIALRFTKMMMHAGLLTIFKKFKVELAEDTPLKINFKPTSLVTQADPDIQLKFIPRNL
ncbi:unnamed protein product, partial [Brenthis ino]